MKNDEFESSLRPLYLKDYIGQSDLTSNLKIFIEAAKKRNETLDHVLLYGPAGLGKTTLAKIIANEMGANIKYCSGPSIEKVGDLASLLSTLEAGDILFIDEIHQIPRNVEEVLYSAMEDFVLQIIINRDVNSKTIDIELPPFTLIGATTKAGCLSFPLRSRFGINIKIDFYSVEELTKIMERTSEFFNIKIEENAAIEIAKRSRGTPRIANQLFKRIRDYFLVHNLEIIDFENATKALNSLKIDELGLNELDISYLQTLTKRFKGGPVGINTISSALGEDVNNIEDVCEPYLIKIGMIDRTAKGRIASKKAYNHLKTHIY